MLTFLLLIIARTAAPPFGGRTHQVTDVQNYHKWPNCKRDQRPDRHLIEQRLSDSQLLQSVLFSLRYPRTGGSSALRVSTGKSTQMSTASWCPTVELMR